MRYSWEFGEMTPGFEWYDGYVKEKSKDNGRNGKKSKGGFIPLFSLFAMFTVISYAAGGIISSGQNDYDEGSSNTAADAVAVMSYGAVNAEVYADSLKDEDVGENEQQSRIGELAAAYIEEYMYEIYGEDSGGEG